jgi:uncharacterized protein YggE
MNEFMQSNQGGRVMKIVSILLLVGVIYMLVLTINEFKTGQYIGRTVNSQNTITVSGEGEVLAKPDIATFSFTISEEGKTVAEAQKKATEKLNKAIDAVKKGGVNGDKDIRTLEYRINPKYEYYYQPVPVACTSTFCPETPVKEPKIIGYEVSQTTEVKVRKLEGAGELLTSVGNLGVQYVGNLQFKVEDEDAVKQEAQAKAIKEAREKAERLANQLGVSLVRVANFSESNYSPLYYGRGGVAVDSMSYSEKAVEAPTISTGENQITSNVTITYEIR